MSDTISDRRLLAAFAVAHWATALDHVGFLVDAGIDVAPPIASRLRREHFMAALVFKDWPITTAEYDRATVTEEARHHCAMHQARLDELLSMRERE